MKWRGKTAGLLAGAMALASSSCATAGSGEKGRLVPAPLAGRELDAAYAPRRIALLVGVDRFEDSSWKGLRFPEKDAEDLAAVLRDPARGAFDEVEVLKGGPDREEVRAALRRLADRNRDERDTVVLYVSSHGTLARDARGELRRWLVARDTRVHDVAASALSMDELKADFDRLRSRRKVLVLAACHSGGGKSLLPDDVQRELEGTKASFFVRPIEEVSRASLILAASDWGETAREDPGLQNDIYTHFLVEALRIGYDRNGDGATTASEAHDYARRMTYEFTGGRQRPSAESAEVGADPIVLVGKVERRGKPELYSYAARLDGFTLRVDGKPIAELPGGAAVDPGRHRVQVSKGGGPDLLDDALVLDPGQRVDLEAILDRSRGAWDVGPRVGIMGYLDHRSRAELLPPVMASGAVLTLRNWPAPRLALRLDVLGSAGSATFRQGTLSAAYDYRAFSVGVALPFRTAFLDGRLVLSAGPRLSAVSLSRTFHLGLLAPQQVLTFTPGLVGGLSWEWGRWVAAVDLQADWMVVRVDASSRGSAYGALIGGAGVRF